MTNYFAQDMLTKLGSKPATDVLTEACTRALECGHTFLIGNDLAKTITDLKGEVAELEEALTENHDDQHVRNELGDVLFDLLNIARIKGINFREVENKIAERWLKRKAYMEMRLQEAGYGWDNYPPELGEQFWREAKQQLKQEEYKE